MDCHRNQWNRSASEGLGSRSNHANNLSPIAVALMAELDPLRRSFRTQVMRVAFMIGLKAHLDGTLG